MKCPVCADVTLVISSREGIEIDHCPQCRGVWLDRGELDKIIDRAAPAAVPASRGREPDFDEPGRSGRGWRDDDDDDDRYRGRRRRRGGFLEDLFDFD